MGALGSVQLDSSEFPSLDAECKYGISSGVKTQLFLFYDSGRDQNKNYFITGDISYNISLADLTFYKRFGIYTTHSSLVNDSKEYLLILEEEDLVDQKSLDAAIEREKARFGCNDFRCAAIKKVYKNDEAAINNDCTLLFNTLPNVLVFNRGFQKFQQDLVAQQLRLDKQYEYVNMTSFFENLTFNSTVAKLNMRNVVKVYEKMMAYKGKPVIFYCNDTNPKGVTNRRDCRDVVAGMAAYLTLKHGFVFEFSPGKESDYLRFARYLVSREFNFLDDYLRIISKPLNVGFRVIEHRMYLMILDSTEMHRRSDEYNVMLDMLCIPLDHEKKTIKNAVVKRRLEPLKHVKYHSLEEYFDILSEDWSKAKKGVRELNSFLQQTEQVLRASKYSVSEPLMINNTLLFEDDGEWFIGFVRRIEGKVRYVASEVSGGFSSFPIDLDLEELSQVYDIRMLEDQALVRKLVKEAGWGSGDFEKYELPEVARGVMFKGLVARSSVLPEDCNATIAELGMWVATSYQFRLTKAQNILGSISLTTARESGLLTCFGGPHPGLTVDINLGIRERGF